MNWIYKWTLFKRFHNLFVFMSLVCRRSTDGWPLLDHMVQWPASWHWVTFLHLLREHAPGSSSYATNKSQKQFMHSAHRLSQWNHWLLQCVQWEERRWQCVWTRQWNSVSEAYYPFTITWLYWCLTSMLNSSHIHSEIISKQFSHCSQANNIQSYLIWYLWSHFDCSCIISFCLSQFTSFYINTVILFPTAGHTTQKLNWKDQVTGVCWPHTVEQGTFRTLPCPKMKVLLSWQSSRKTCGWTMEPGSFS